ncbi:MAG: hypothetical protein OXC80_13175 [Gammaproteobacteria bacterium]|nr:hypothetical protein [Gammaproteobacteria bacterium]
MAILGVAVVLVTLLIVVPVFSSAIPIWVKLLIALPILGGGILLAVVIKDRYREAPHDKYKDIER